MTLQKGPTTPGFLQLVQWISSPLTFMEKNAKRYGEVLELDLTRKLLFFSNPKAIQEIFATNPKKFDCGEANDILQPIVGNNSLLLLDGSRHKRHRSLLMPPFHQERIKAYGELICDLTREVTKKWIPGKPFIARNAARDISIEVILQAVFGLSEGERYDQLRQMLAQILETMNSPWKSSMLFFKKLQMDLGPWSPWGKFARRRQEIDKLLYAEISDRRASLDPEARDILTLMLEATDAEGQPLTDEECKDELLTLLFGGHETTATAIAWALYSIHKHPEVRAKLLAELATLGDNPEPMAIAKLPYLNGVCNESLRMYPVIIMSFPRIAKEPITINAEHYDEGTKLVPCMYLVHRREDLYPEPDKFKPERFLERKFSPYEFFPFGGGNRRCIGAALAMMEMKLVLATILLNYKLALASERPVRVTWRGSLLAPAGGIKMVMLERLANCQ